MKVRKATNDDAKFIGNLIYSTENYPEGEWGQGSKDELMNRLVAMIKKRKNRFSAENIWVLEDEGEKLGAILALDGSRIRMDTLRADRNLIKMQKTIIDKLKFTSLAVGYLFYNEGNKDEYYISNIAITKVARGRGLSKVLLEEIYRVAKYKGYKKVSLRANNQKLIEFYSSLGFKLENRSKDKMIKII